VKSRNAMHRPWTVAAPRNVLYFEVSRRSPSGTNIRKGPPGRMGRTAALLWSYATTTCKVSRRTLGVVLDGEAAPPIRQGGGLIVGYCACTINSAPVMPL
jgi:hypothetical protein